MSLLPHLEEIEVLTCSSVEVVFNIDMDRDREIVECNSRLRSIKVYELGQLKEIWRVRGGNNSDIIILSFQAVETIHVEECESFRNLFTPTTSNFDMRALTNLMIRSFEESREDNISNEEQEINAISKDGVHDDYFSFSFPPNLIHNINNLDLENFNGVEVMFEINSPPLRSRELETAHHQQLLFPYLKECILVDLKRMSHVWKCSSNWNWNDFFQKQQQPFLVSSFHNLTTIYMERCHNIEYLFSSFMAKLLSNLKKVTIYSCNRIEEVVSSRDDNEEMPTLSSTHTITSFFPHFHSLSLVWLHNLKHIGGGGDNDRSKLSQAGVVSWYLCQYIREIKIDCRDALSVVIPSYAVGKMQKLEKLDIEDCESLKEIFESQGIVSGGGGSTYINVPQLSHLREIEISNCELLEYVFTFSTLERLRQLQTLKIENCKAMKDIVKQEVNTEQAIVVFPCLKFVKLIDLPNLLGFFLGMNDFEWKSLEEVMVRKCPKVKAFTRGCSTAPNLNFIHSSLGKHHIPECGLNFEIIPSNELLQVKNLERIELKCCHKVEEIFEGALEGTNTPLQIPNLKEVELEYLAGLKYICKNNEGMVLEFPNLTRLVIKSCDSLKHVFTSSMVGSLLQLQHLQITSNENIEVIVKEEDECDGKVKPIELPRLKSLTLHHLWNLKGFCLEKDAFSFPSLDTLEIFCCPVLMVFTEGRSTAPKLKRTKVTNVMYDLKGDLNTFVNTKLQEGLIF